MERKRYTFSLPVLMAGLCLAALCVGGCARGRQEELEHGVSRRRPGIWPVNHPARRVSSPFGMRRHPRSGRMRMHQGIDIVVPRGTPVRATADGVVKFSGRQRDYGNIIVLDHGGGMETAYAHLDARLVTADEKVRQGQTIGKVGKTGNATGVHLHYEVRVNGCCVDPAAYLP